MFKKFKDKLAEEMKQSPARLQAGMQQLAQVVPSITNISTSELSTSTDNFSLTDGDDETPRNTSEKFKLQAVDLTSYSSNSIGLSRSSSVNSVTSMETSGLFPIYENPGSTYHLQSDIDQSASEVDEHINPQYEQLTKEQIYSAYRKVQTKYHKYRGHYRDLVNHYREIERVNSKLESVLLETQDKTWRRISDLKEQCQLEKQAKAHLEEALRNDIEEKDHIIDTLNMKVKLLQANGTSTLTLQNQDNLIDIVDNKDTNENNSAVLFDNISIERPYIPEPVNSIKSELIDENQQLKNKLDKLENLIIKYKESLKRNKDKITEITQDKLTLEHDLDMIKKSNNEQMQLLKDNLNESQANIIILKEKINKMKQIEEESAISLAENKLSIHRELEIKEEQIKQLTLELKETIQMKENYRMKVDNNSEVIDNDVKINSTDGIIKNEFIESEKQLCSDNNMDPHKYLQQEERIKSLNEMMQIYLLEINEAKEKIQIQESEINQLTRESTENYEKLKIELENKSDYIVKLEKEIINLNSKVSQFDDKLRDNVNINDHLMNKNNYLIKNIDNYMKIIQSLKFNCDELKLTFKNSEINQKQELNQISKLIQEKISNCQSHLVIETSNETIKSYESKLESKNNEIININEKLCDSELQNSKLIAELDNVNCKIFDIIKQRDKAEDNVKEIIEEKNLLYKKFEEIEFKNVNQIEIMKTMEEEIEKLRQTCTSHEEECKKLSDEILDKTTKFNNTILKIKSENEIYKNNIAENEIQMKNMMDKYNKIIGQYENLKSEFNDNKILLEETSIKSQNLIADNLKLFNENSALNIQVKNLTDMVYAKNEFIEKLKFFKVHCTKIIDDKNHEIAEILKEKNKLINLHEELNLKQNQYKDLEEKIVYLSNNNDELKSELDEQRKINDNLKNENQKINMSMAMIEEDLQNYKEKSEIEKNKMQNVENKLLKANQELENNKKILETRVEELENLSQVYVKDIENLKMEIDNKIIEMEKLRNENNLNLEDNCLEGIVEELRSQLQEKESMFITCQAAQSQNENENEKLRNDVKILQEKLGTAETEQAMRMQQLVKEFQARLHDKDTELQAALDQKFDWQKNYESELVQQYREQLKDFQKELTAKSEEIEDLKIYKNADGNKEIEKLIDTIAIIKKEHTNELKDVDVKWRDTLKQKCDELEAKHNLTINELTNEWKKKKFTDENIQNSEELEKMSAVAMATVQSNTGSFHSLQQTLVNQRRELIELRKLVKLRQETLDDSTEIEYLRNILYEYMMGKETLVLARVIAAVVKFDQNQTDKILKKEEDKLTLLGSLGLT